MDNTIPTARLHALDNLRALMMWLGIVLHVAAIHMVQNSPLPWADDKRTTAADLTVAFIHAFRMPVFFILGGFFVAMLLASRGPAGMAKHRAIRLGLPFAVFWLPLLMVTVAAALLFIYQIERGTWGLDMGLVDVRAAKAHLPHLPRGPNTMHMWFLWMLLWMSLATAMLAQWLPTRVWAVPAQWLRRAASAWWGPLVLALPLVATDAGYPKGFLYPSGAFIPPPAEWLHNGLFFIMGLAIFSVRTQIFESWTRHARWFAAAGAVTFIVSGALVKREMAAPFALAYGLTTWFWSIAVIAAGLRWLPTRSPVLGYLSDSSYWVYLVHFPLTIAFGSLLYLTDLPALLKMLLNITATTFVCVATYHLFVRYTWVSVLLNGKRHTRAPRPPAALTPA